MGVGANRQEHLDLCVGARHIRRDRPQDAGSRHDQQRLHFGIRARGAGLLLRRGLSFGGRGRRSCAAGLLLGRGLGFSGRGRSSCDTARVVSGSTRRQHQHQRRRRADQSHPAPRPPKHHLRSLHSGNENQYQFHDRESCRLPQTSGGVNGMRIGERTREPWKWAPGWAGRFCGRPAARGEPRARIRLRLHPAAPCSARGSYAPGGQDHGRLTMQSAIPSTWPPGSGAGSKPAGAGSKLPESRTSRVRRRRGNAGAQPGASASADLSGRNAGRPHQMTEPSHHPCWRRGADPSSMVCYTRPVSYPDRRETLWRRVGIVVVLGTGGRLGGEERNAPDGTTPRGEIQYAPGWPVGGGGSGRRGVGGADPREAHRCSGPYRGTANRDRGQEGNVCTQSVRGLGCTG